jgi:signal transduction histidine kinase
LSVANIVQAPNLGPGSFEAIFELAPAPLALIRASHPVPCVATVNEAFLQSLMISRLAVEGRRIDAVFRAAAAAQIRPAVEQCLATGEPVRLRVAHAAAAKVARLRIEIRRVVLGQEPFAILSLTILDRLGLSELGEAGVLAELGALSRGLVYIQDVPGGRVQYGRHPLVKKLGLPPGPLAMENVRDQVHPEDLERFRAYLGGQAAAQDDRVTALTFRMRGAEEQWLWINIRSRVFTRDQDNAVHRVIGVATDETETHVHAEAMAAAADALNRAEVNERRRIGRELHDSTASLLVAASLSLSTVERRSELTPAGQSALDDARQAIAGAQGEIRNFSYILHPPSLQSEGLAQCLRVFAAGFSRRTGLEIGVRIGFGLGRLSSRLELALYRIAQEALMNVYRHADATRARLSLKRVNGQVVLEIEDNGKGLETASARTVGVGISGMEARMTQLGGTFALDASGRGLLVRATAPIRSPLDD